MLSWWLTAALDPDFRLIQYFFLIKYGRIHASPALPICRYIAHP